MQETMEKRRGGKTWRTVLKTAAEVLALVLLVVALAAVYLFHYALDPRMPGGMLDGGGWEYSAEDALLRAGCEDRWLTARDGTALHALYRPGEEGGHRYAVVCHGYGGDPLNMIGFTSRFHDLGFHVLAPAARAHEESGGRFVSMGWLERLDVVDWVDTLVERDPEAEIVLFGVSMGGATVMMAAGEDLPENVACIVEDCGYSSVWDEFAVQLKEMFRLPAFPVLDAASAVCRIRAGYGFKEASAVKQLEKASLPMLFIHGEEDAFVPWPMLDVVYAACASGEKERLSVPGAAHGGSAGTDPALYWGTVEGFLEKHME